MEIVAYNDDYSGKWIEFLKVFAPDKNSDHFQWKYKRRYGTIYDNLLLIVKNDIVVGCLASLTDEALIFGKKIKVNTLVDFFVIEKYRDGCGLYLLHNYLRKFPNNLFLSLPNKDISPLYDLLKWRNISTLIQRFYFPISFTYALNRKYNLKIPAKIDSIIYNTLIALVKLKNNLFNFQCLSIVHTDLAKLTEINKIISLWTNITNRVGIDFVCSITPDYFKKYKKLFLQSRASLIVAYDESKQPVAACIVTFNNKMHAEITEYVGENKKLKFLFIAAIDYVFMRKGKVIAITTSISDHMRLLNNMLFFKNTETNAYLYSGNRDVRKKLNQIRTISITSGNSDGWF